MTIITKRSKGSSVPVAKVEQLPRFTGRKLMIMNKESDRSSLTALAKKSNLKIANIKDYASGTSNFNAAFREADGLYFDTFKIAVINQNRNEELEHLKGLAAGTNKSFISEPERFVYAIAKAAKKRKKPRRIASYADSDIYTWGVQAVSFPSSKYTGKGVNVAILDTGLNLKHPDFSRFTIISRSFIKKQTVDDRNGHGTHCSGVAVGAVNQATNQRYGIASEANLYIGKVLDNAGEGYDSGILAGIEWAIQQKCRVISMSLGGEVNPGETYSPSYERVARTALRKNCLIVAAAGNESQREFGLIKPVGHPANCPSILSVAAVDSNLGLADFSCGGINPEGGQVDIAGPGVDIYSSWKSRSYLVESGTSMAAPFVAGVAATYCEANPNATAAEIWMMLTQNALRMSLSSSDVGSGLVQCLR